MVKSIKRFFEPEHTCTHPVSCAFEDWTVNSKNRTYLSIILAIVTSLFSQINRICLNEKCYNYFFQVLFKTEITSQTYLLKDLLHSFSITFMFFFLFWMIVLSIAAWIHVKRLLPEIAIPLLLSLFVLYILVITSGSFSALMMETDAIECVSDKDCIRAGYCGEVCTSVYQPVYTTYNPNCEPVDTCTCVDNKCVGS